MLQSIFKYRDAQEKKVDVTEGNEEAYPDRCFHAEELGVYQNEELVKVAYQICRWHHERYDGKGYPDGLKGEEIPIAAQVVSVADVYDALTSERVYKKAFSHEKAMEMILAGECGTFNPLLLECLQDIQGNIQVEMKRAAEQPMLVQNSYVGKMIETVQ